MPSREPSPREIVARLHEETAAKSLEHAVLAAEFERRQAERDGTYAVGPGAGWPDTDELAEMSMHDQEIWERRCAEAEAAEVAAHPSGGTP